MHKLWLVIKREYLTRVRTKGFVITTIIVPVLTVGILVLQIVTATRQAGHTLRIAVLDEAGGLGSAVARDLSGRLPSGQPEFQVVQVLENPPAGTRENVRARVLGGELDAFLVLPASLGEGKASAEFHTRNPGEVTISRELNHDVSNAVIGQRLQARGVDIRDVAQVVKGVDLKVIKVGTGGDREEQGQTIVLAIVVGMLLYTTLIIYGVATMRSVMEEKTTRVIEVLVASTRPFYLLVGKIMGVAAVGLTQYAIWVTAGALVTAYGAAVASMAHAGALPSLHLSWSMLACTMIFFLMGYLLYASLYAAVGAMVSSDQEAQQAQMPVTMLIVAAVVLFNVIIRDPNSSLSTTLSMIPFFAPILMLLRIALQTPPLWQIGLCLGILALSTAGIVFVAARIYRVGILMYGKRPSLAELVKWVKYT
ncbi:MAG TPA: ABC transporter permease [Terriglobia bacterium]|nr:ABC transporter permease [Terriglobia bacterium]